MSRADRRGQPSPDTQRAARRAVVSSNLVHHRIRSAMRTSRASVNRSGRETRPQILVIEHDTLTRETLALMLQYYGYDVTLASDGREATRLLADMTPDLVVMDWRTPGLSGFALCVALRRRWPMMPIVVVTSSDEVFDGDRPVNAWLQKPIDPPLLNQVIHDELAPVRSA